MGSLSDSDPEVKLSVKVNATLVAQSFARVFPENMLRVSPEETYRLVSALSQKSAVG